MGELKNQEAADQNDFHVIGLMILAGNDLLELPMSAEKDHARALRYRRLAFAEMDRAKAEVLNQIADEAERGVLYTADRLKTISTPPSTLPYGRGLGGW